MSYATVHDGFATIRSARTVRVVPRSLEPVLEDSAAGVCLRLRKDVPWWELATRKYRYRSCSTFQIGLPQVISPYSIVKMYSPFLGTVLLPKK